MHGCVAASSTKPFSKLCLVPAPRVGFRNKARWRPWARQACWQGLRLLSHGEDGDGKEWSMVQTVFTCRSPASQCNLASLEMLGPGPRQDAAAGSLNSLLGIEAVGSWQGLRRARGAALRLTCNLRRLSSPKHPSPVWQSARPKASWEGRGVRRTVDTESRTIREVESYKVLTFT